MVGCLGFLGWSWPRLAVLGWLPMLGDCTAWFAWVAWVAWVACAAMGCLGCLGWEGWALEKNKKGRRKQTKAQEYDFFAATNHHVIDHQTCLGQNICLEGQYGIVVRSSLVATTNLACPWIDAVRRQLPKKYILRHVVRNPPHPYLLGGGDGRMFVFPLGPHNGCADG